MRQVLLNNIDHQDLRVIVRHGGEFGDSINQTLIFPTEFEEIQREYPIVFRKDAEGEFQSVALLGLDKDPISVSKAVGVLLLAAGTLLVVRG